jgi:ketosteroid isomerase-like protein
MTSDKPPLRIGLKYCGGCKPNYDRVALVRRLAGRLGQTALFVGPDGGDLDLVLAVYGCPTACADLSRCKAPVVWPISRDGDADRFIEYIENPQTAKGAVMKLSRAEIQNALAEWNQAWARYDLDGVMALMHDDVLFENWTGGKAVGKEALAKAWKAWFAQGGFRFIEEELFIDEEAQKVLFRWVLDWPCPAKGHEGKRERRKGVDVMHFQEGRIINKLTFSQTTVEIDGQRHSLRL